MKRYALLPVLLCIFLSACSEMPYDYPYSRPQKDINGIKWTSDGQTLVAYVAIPISQSRDEYRFYTYNSNGEKISETPSLNLAHSYVSDFFLSSDGKYALVGYDPLEVVELSTGNIVASYDDILLFSQAFGTDEYIMTGYSNRYERYPYVTYTLANITASGIDSLSHLRILGSYTYSNVLDPFFASKKRLVTGEYDSLNVLHFTVRDSSLIKLHETPIPDKAGYIEPQISIKGDKVAYGSYNGYGFLYDLTTGSIDSSHDLQLSYYRMQINSNGDKVYGVPDNSYTIISYDIASKTKTILSTYPNRKYMSSFSLSPDDKHVAFVLGESGIDDQLVVLDLP